MAKNIQKNTQSVIVRRTSGKSLSGRDGIELVFDHDRKLSDTEVKSIKNMGFRWSRNQQLWYAAYSDELFARAQKRFGAVAEAPVKAKATAAKTTKTTKTKKAEPGKAIKQNAVAAKAAETTGTKSMSDVIASLLVAVTDLTLEVEALKAARAK